MKNYKKKLILISIIILVLSFFVEIFIFNYNYFTKENNSQNISKVSFENILTLDNDHYIIQEDEAAIILKDLNQFVNRLEFHTDSFGKNINIQISYNGKTKIDNIYNINKKSVYINESVDNITISFINEKGKEVLIDDFKTVNGFNFNWIRFFIIILFFILLSIILSLIQKKGKIRLETVFLVLMISFGFLYTIMTPVFYSWDEEEHFIKAYNLANFNLVMREGEGISYPSNADDFLDKKINTDKPNYRSFEEYKEITENLLKINYDDTEVVYYPSTAITYTLAPYLFSMLGILLTKMMHLPFLVSFYFGRFFNVLLYAILGFFSIKFIPTGKKLLFVCMLLPTVVFQAASYSADVAINGYSFFVFSIIINWLFNKKRLTKLNLAAICICFILVTASKVTYAPIFLLILILKTENFTDKKKEWLIKASVLFLGVITAVAVFIYSDRMGIAQWPIPEVNYSEQLKTIIYNPINFIWVMIKTMLVHKEALLAGGTVSLAYAGYLGKSMLITVYIFLGLIALTDTEKTILNFGIRDRFIVFIMCLVTISLSMVALYLTFTPVNYGEVLGFQGRYLVPLVFPLLFLFQRGKTSSFVRPEIITGMVVVFSISSLTYSILYIFNLYYI